MTGIWTSNHTIACIKGCDNMSVEIVYNEQGKTFQEVIEQVFTQYLKSSYSREERKKKMSNYEIYNTAIYLRLSRDDGTEKESESIQNQKSFLMQYVIKNGFNLVDIYVDDGWSGTSFDRPSFKRLISDIENVCKGYIKKSENRTSDQKRKRNICRLYGAVWV